MDSGIMLLNHSTLKISEDFGLLFTSFPGRIDFGIGRAPGRDRLWAYLNWLRVIMLMKL